MRETTPELIKKIGEDSVVFISATEALTCWIVYTRVPRSPAERTHHLHHGIKYVTRPNENGNVLILRDPFISNASSVESRGQMETIDGFVENAVGRIPVDRNAVEKGQEEGCWTSCG